MTVGRTDTASVRHHDHPAAPTGLRELHKVRTRMAIREAAMTLFEQQGYAATTVEHIAREAEVSPTTFFRYFQTKEQVVAGDLAEARRAVFANMPPGLSRFGIIRELVTQLYRIAVQDEWISDPRRRALIRREPVLIAAHAAATERAIIEAREFIAAYLGVDPDDFGLRVFIGAVGGAMSTIAQGDAENPHGDGGLDELLRAVDLLECGLPVGS